MSNRKRNVAFTKPDEPNFLKIMKAEIGYKEIDPEEDLNKKVNKANILKIRSCNCSFYFRGKR